MLYALALWALLILSATYFQFRAIVFAIKVCRRINGGVYVYRKYESVFFYVDKPTTVAHLLAPDFALCANDSIRFAPQTYLHKSFLLSFGPVIPGVLYLILFGYVQRSQKIDKYLIKDSYVNELAIQQPKQSS